MSGCQVKDYPERIPARVFEAQVREVYQLGVFLAKKKFRVLRLAYVTFIVGLVASAIVLAFTTAP